VKVHWNYECIIHDKSPAMAMTKIVFKMWVCDVEGAINHRKFFLTD